MFGASLPLPPSPWTTPPPPLLPPLPPIVQRPQRYFTPTQRIAMNQTPTTIATILLTTSAISILPLFPLQTLRSALSFRVGLLTLFHPCFTTNHQHLMVLIRQFILKRCYLFFGRSSASVSDAWCMPFVPSLPTSMPASCAHGPTAVGDSAASRQASSGPSLGEFQHLPWSHGTLRRRPAAYGAR